MDPPEATCATETAFSFCGLKNPFKCEKCATNVSDFSHLPKHMGPFTKFGHFFILKFNYFHFCELSKVDDFDKSWWQSEPWRELWVENSTFLSDWNSKAPNPKKLVPTDLSRSFVRPIEIEEHFSIS